MFDLNGMNGFPKVLNNNQINKIIMEERKRVRAQENHP